MLNDGLSNYIMKWEVKLFIVTITTSNRYYNYVGQLGPYTAKSKNLENQSLRQQLLTGELIWGFGDERCQPGCKRIFLSVTLTYHKWAYQTRKLIKGSHVF